MGRTKVVIMGIMERERPKLYGWFASGTPIMRPRCSVSVRADIAEG